MNIRVLGGGLTAEEYITIKESAKWGKVPEAPLVEEALEKSLFHVVARDGEKAVAMGRLLGDGVFYWHIQDVIVLPEYQGKGIGKAVMDSLMEYIRENSPQGSSVNIGLMAAKSKDGFYEKLGFVSRPSEKYGPGMVQWVAIPSKDEDINI